MTTNLRTRGIIVAAIIAGSLAVIFGLAYVVVQLHMRIGIILASSFVALLVAWFVVELLMSKGSLGHMPEPVYTERRDRRGRVRTTHDELGVYKKWLTAFGGILIATWLPIWPFEMPRAVQVGLCLSVLSGTARMRQLERVCRERDRMGDSEGMTAGANKIEAKLAEFREKYKHSLVGKWQTYTAGWNVAEWAYVEFRLDHTGSIREECMFVESDEFDEITFEWWEVGEYSIAVNRRRGYEVPDASGRPSEFITDDGWYILNYDFRVETFTVMASWEDVALYEPSTSDDGCLKFFGLDQALISSENLRA